MAHPYSSTPLYAGAPTYAPQQPFYPPYSSNTMQQSMPTPPGMPQQQQAHYQPQQSPSTNGPRFDANSRVHPPAPFPPFPPPTFNTDFFKQFANAGFPPPPPPNFAPMPVPSTGYAQLPVSVTASPSSPYPQYQAGGAQGYGPHVSQHEPPRQYGEDSSHQDTWAAHNDTQTYGTPNISQIAKPHIARPAAKSVDNEKGRCVIL